MAETKRTVTADPLPGYPREIGLWLWALQEVRKRTLRTIAQLDQRTLDWAGPGGEANSIGTLLYHIAFVEMDWLFTDVKERAFPTEVSELLPHLFSEEGRLTGVRGESLLQHCSRLDRTRAVLLEEFASVSMGEWGRLRLPVGGKYESTPQWVVFHLVEHEAGHNGQIAALKAGASRQFAR